MLRMTHTLFPHRLARWCAESRRLCVHISTNAVFPSDESRIWLPEDAPNPDTPYARAKAEGEDPRQYIVRASFLGKSPRGTGLFDALMAGKPYEERRWNGVTALTLAERIADIVAAHSGEPIQGLEHVHSPEAVAVGDIARWLGSASTTTSRKTTALLGGGRPCPSLELQVHDYLRYLRCRE